MSEFDRKFLLSLARFIRSRPDVFEEGGRLLDRKFSLEALTTIRERKIRATHNDYDEQRGLLESTGKLDRHEEEILANQVRLGGITRPLEELRKERLEQIHHHAEGDRQHLTSVDTMLGAPLVRLLRAVGWAKGGDQYYGPPTHLEDMQAICLVTWLAFEPAANRTQPILTRFQALPWMPRGKIDGFEMQGRFFLHDHIADEHSELVRVVKEALEFVELALVTPATYASSPLEPASEDPDDAAEHEDESDQDGSTQTEPDCRHGSDFLWAIWYGTKYKFAKGNQASVVRELWKEWERGGRVGGCGLTQETLQERVAKDSPHSFQVRSIFRRGSEAHHAWGTMIRDVGKGAYALCPPDWQP